MYIKTFSKIKVCVPRQNSKLGIQKQKRQSILTRYCKQIICIKDFQSDFMSAAYLQWEHLKSHLGLKTKRTDAFIITVSDM